MKRFFFGLQNVLNYRVFLERKAQEKLARSINEYLEKEHHMNMTVARRNEYANMCSMEKQTGMDVSRYWLYQSFFRRINAELELAELALIKSEAYVQMNRDILLKETIRKKTLEKLKDIKRMQYAMACEREDQKALDEMVISRGRFSL